MKRPLDKTPSTLAPTAANSAAQFGDRRQSGERLVSVLRVGAAVIEGRRELCLIRNLSTGGMMLKLFEPVVVGQPLSVEMKAGEPIAGQVSWIRDGAVGVAFTTPVDVEALLAQVDEGPRPRLPRIELSLTATVREGAIAQRMRLCDISQGGMKFEGEARLSVGAAVVVSLTGLAPQPGVVRWCLDGFAGVALNRPIALVVLVDWLHAQREARQAA